MELTHTQRGFARIDFADVNQEMCSLQESSSDEPCIWLGTCGARMHLSQEMVAELLPYLQRFADHGVVEGINPADDMPFGENDGVLE